jgi:Ca2+/Na+ antiporter
MAIDVFLAPSDLVLGVVLENMLQIKEQSKEMREQEFKSQMAAKYSNIQEPITDAMINADALQAEYVPPLIAWPNTGSCMTRLVHVLLFPFKLAIHVTIPDVRVVAMTKAGPSLRTATISVIMSIVWLIPWTYVMVLSLEIIGRHLQINDVIMGLTFSAAGTAIPNYIASHVAATQGFSNMAISNAIGSNIFNILICLGIPWVTFTSVRDGSYMEKWDSNIKLSMILMIVVHVIFSFIITYSGFKLSSMNAVSFLGIYLVFVIVAVSFSRSS